jgi:hypothetical protein
MYPNRTEILSNAASRNGRSSALHTLVSTLVIPCVKPGHGQPPLATARGNIEMLLITGDAQTLDHRRADRAQLIHDDRGPTSPSPQKARPTPPAERPGSHRRPASALRYQMHPPNTKALPGGST